MTLAYRGYSVIIIAPLMALLAVSFHADFRLLAFYTQVFMTGLAGFIVKYFPIFLLGAVFGKLMEISGAASQIAGFIVRRLGARNAIQAIVISCIILTYGGVSLFVVAFAVYPMASAIFLQADIPKRLVPASIGLGSFTISMTALPGTVQIQNLIPMPYFRTDAFAAPVFGLAASAIILLTGLSWLNWRSRTAAKVKEGFGSHPDLGEVKHVQSKGILKAVSPIVLIISANYLMANYLFNSMDLSYLSEGLFGNISPEAVVGLWSMIASLSLGILLLIILYMNQLSQLPEQLLKGANSALVPIFNTASEVGYGSTIAALAGFAYIKSWVVGISPENPLISQAIAVNILAGITGSASGGLSIALEALGDQYYQLALEQGLNPELLHRVASMACGGLDSLPHNGAVITLLAICGLSHKESYLDIGVTTLVIPLGTLALLLSFSSLYL